MRVFQTYTNTHGFLCHFLKTSQLKFLKTEPLEEKPYNKFVVRDGYVWTSWPRSQLKPPFPTLPDTPHLLNVITPSSRESRHTHIHIQPVPKPPTIWMLIRRHSVSFQGPRRADTSYSLFPALPHLSLLKPTGEKKKSLPTPLQAAF